MSEYLIQEETLVALANQARRFSGTEDSMNTIDILEILSKTQGSVRSEEGEYLVQAFGYNNELLKSEQMNTGEIFALPRDMSYPDNLKYIGWRIPNQDDTKNFMVVGNSDSVTVAEFELKGEASEIVINIPSSLIRTVVLTNLDSTALIDWGDGVLTDKTSHTYYYQSGELTIKVYNTHTFSIGEGIKYVQSIMYSNNIMSIPDCSSSTSYLYEKLINVLIPGNVKSIGKYAFYNSGLNCVMINRGVESIGEHAFDYCSNLIRVFIPESITAIGNNAFKLCSNLISVTIPNSVTTIGDSAFSFCDSLTSVAIPNSVTEIGKHVFGYCRALKKVVLPQELTKIPSMTFNECTSLASIEIPQNITEINSSAFLNCTSLTSIVIPNSMSIIWSDAFKGCTGLSSAVYQGTAEEWNKVTVQSGNDALTNIITFAG